MKRWIVGVAMLGVIAGCYPGSPQELRNKAAGQIVSQVNRPLPAAFRSAVDFATTDFWLLEPVRDLYPDSGTVGVTTLTGGFGPRDYFFVADLEKEAEDKTRVTIHYYLSADKRRAENWMRAIEGGSAK